MKTTIRIKKSTNWAAWSNNYVGDKLIAVIDEKGVAQVDFKENALSQELKKGVISGFVNPEDFIEN